MHFVQRLLPRIDSIFTDSRSPSGAPLWANTLLPMNAVGVIASSSLNFLNVARVRLFQNLFVIAPLNPNRNISLGASML